MKFLKLKIQSRIYTPNFAVSLLLSFRYYLYNFRDPAGLDLREGPSGEHVPHVLPAWLGLMLMCVMCRSWRCMKSRMDAGSSTTAATAPAPAQSERPAQTSSRAFQTAPPRPLTPVITYPLYCILLLACCCLFSLMVLSVIVAIFKDFMCVWKLTLEYMQFLYLSPSLFSWGGQRCC